MNKDFRVTVVATGLGQPLARPQPVPMRVVNPSPSADAPNYADFERPPKQRQQATVDTEGSGQVKEPSLDLLDIPAFLRRQAD
jgi:cell division protein FtsZ